MVISSHYLIYLKCEMSESEIDNIEMDTYKLRDKQKTLEIDNSVENIQKDDICTGNPVEFKSNMYKFQDNKSIDLMGE